MVRSQELFQHLLFYKHEADRKRYQVLQQNTCTEVSVSSSNLGIPAQLSQSGLQILVLH